MKVFCEEMAIFTESKIVEFGTIEFLCPVIAKFLQMLVTFLQKIK